MDFSVVEHLADEYVLGELCGRREDTPEQVSFYGAYVDPMYETGFENGDNMETAIVRMLDAEVMKAFSDGFKIGIGMMSEVMTGAKKAVMSNE